MTPEERARQLFCWSVIGPSVVAAIRAAENDAYERAAACTYSAQDAARIRELKQQGESMTPANPMTANHLVAVMIHELERQISEDWATLYVGYGNTASLQVEGHVNFVALAKAILAAEAK